MSFVFDVSCKYFFFDFSFGFLLCFWCVCVLIIQKLSIFMLSNLSVLCLFESEF